MISELVTLLRDTYLKEAKKKLSPERIAVLVILILGYYYSSYQDIDKSLVRYLYRLNLADFLALNSEILSHLTIGDTLFIGVLFLSNSFIYKSIKKSFFYYLARTQGFKENIQRRVDQLELVFSNERESENIEYLKRKKIESDRYSADIKRLHSFAEILLSVLLVMIWNLSSNVLTVITAVSFQDVQWDFLLTLALAAVILLIQSKTYLIYLSKLLPILIADAVFTNKNVDHSIFFEKEIKQSQHN